MPAPQDVRPRGHLRVRLLGSLAVRVDDAAEVSGPWRLRKARSLLVMLALAPGQRCRRELVLDRLWPELAPTAAARNLHQTLYVARRTLAGLGAAPETLLVLRDEHVVLDADGAAVVDVDEFERLALAALAPGGDAHLRAAAELYTGDLLTDGAEAAWLDPRRDELRATHQAVLVRLATSMLGRSPEEALVLLTELLRADPLHEGAVRAQMLLLAELGRRSEALARYERLVDGLLDEFGTDPDPQTTALFRGLLTAPSTRPPLTGDVGLDPGSLPASVSSFVGRDREVGDVARLLERARLLTLIGAGGCGKTRLAVEAARAVRSRYADGVWFVDLAVTDEAVQVPGAVISALRLDPGAVPDRLQVLVDQLRGRKLLVVLDNCEHLLSACAHLVAVLLAGCPDVHVLATSRAPLHAPGEYTLRVPSLALPAPVGTDPPDLAELGSQASVQLFVERAGQVRPGFALTADNAAAVGELCRRLDGIPLALELAAARCGVLEPAEIVDRLSDALALLRLPGGGVTRHQTLRGTLEWSHDLLGSAQQVLLRRLSVFVAGFTAEALDAVCAGELLPRDALFDLLADLVDHSLVVAEQSASGTRYRQLETVRQLGRENLHRAAEEEQLNAAHAAYYLELAVRHNPERAVGVVIEAPRALDDDHDNLRAALRWSCVHDPATALRLVASLWRFWFVRGHAVEGAGWAERALAAAPEPTRPRAAALIGLTGLDSRQGRSDRHRALGAEALAIVRQIGEPGEILSARVVDALLAWSTFDLSEAEGLAADVRRDAQSAGRPEQVAATSWLLGQCALSREDGPTALRHLGDCLSELAGCTVATPFLPVVTACLQLVPVAGRLLPCFEETMLLGRRVGTSQGTAFALAALGDAARLTGDRRRAIADVADAAEQLARLGDDLGRGQALNQLGCVLRDVGDHAAARRALASAREVRLGVGDRRGQLLTEVQLALLSGVEGDLERGTTGARHCLAEFELSGDRVGMAASLTGMAAIEVVAGHPAAARELYGWTAELSAPWRRLAGWARLLEAELSVELGDGRRAERETAQALAAFGSSRCLVADQHLAGLRRPAGEGVEVVLRSC